MGKQHLMGVIDKDGAANDKQSTMRVERRVAECMRQVQVIGGYKTPSELLEAMIVTFVRHELPNCELQFAPDASDLNPKSGKDRRARSGTAAPRPNEQERRSVKARRG